MFRQSRNFKPTTQLDNLNPGDRLLDTGCGRGLIAMNVASWYNTSVVGVNIDETQVAHAKRLAFDAHMENRLQFIQQG